MAVWEGLKDHHPWEQGLLPEAVQILGSLSYKNDLVINPLLGSGMVAVAWKRMKRRFVGRDKSIDAVNISLSRLAQQMYPFDHGD